MKTTSRSNKKHTAPHSLRPLPLVLALQAAFAWPLAQATSFTVTTGTDTTAKTVTSGDTGAVSSGATLESATSTNAVTITGTSGTATITNDGTIANSSTGRAIDNNTNGVAIVITNNGTISAVSSDALRLNQANSTLVLNNNGTISVTGAVSATASGQALDLRGASGTGTKTINNGSSTNSSAVISSTNDDALRPGTNTTINNYGTIITTSTVNTKCPDYLGTTACAAAISAHDGIDAGARTGVVLNNYGTVSGARHGVTADTSITVTNYEGGTIIGRNGSGVGSDGTGTVINYGTISGRYVGAGKAYDQLGNGSTYTDPTLTTVNNGDGDGVDIDGIGTITNYGRIEGTGGGGYDSGGRPNGGDGIALGGGTVVNQTGAVIWGDSNGILVDDGANGTDTTNLTSNKNRGTSLATASAVTITNYGTITGSRKVAVGLVGDWNDALINYATGVITGGTEALQVNKLSTDSTQTAGAAVQMGDGDDTLTNYGRIEGKNGLAIDMGNGNDTVKLFGGTVVGTIDGGAGTNTLETDGAQSFNSGTLSNFQNFIVRGGSTTFNYALGTVSSVQIDNGGTLRIEGTFGTTGDLTVNGTLKAATSTTDLRTVNVAGNYSQGASGVLEVGVKNSSADQINATGTATLSNGATIRPVARGYVADGATFHIVTGAGGLTTTPASLTVDNSSYLVSYTLSQSGNDLVLTAQRNSSASGSVATGQTGVLTTLETLGQSGNSSIQPLLAALNNLSTATDYANAVQQTAPETNGVNQRASQQATGALLSTLGNRIDGARSGTLALGATGLAAGDNPDHRAWVQGLGAWGQQGARSGQTGFMLGTAGLAAGLETDRSAREVMGLSFGYTQTQSSGIDSAQGDNVRLNGYHVGGYYNEAGETTTLDALLSLGYNDYKAQRLVAFSGFSQAATGTYTGWSIGGSVEWGLPFTLSSSWGGRWLAGVRAGYLNTYAYTESGNAAITQSVGANYATSLQSVLGGELTQSLDTNRKLLLRARYLHEFAGSPDVVATFTAGGPSFSASGATPNRDALQIGVAYRRVTQQGVTLTLGYDAEARDSYLSHQLTAHALWSF